MVRQVGRVETYELSRHDLADNLGIVCDKVVQVRLIEGSEGIDDPVIQITVEVLGKEEEKAP